MSEKEKKEVKLKPKKDGKKPGFMNINWDRPKIILLFCSIVILIPTIFFVYILFSAYTSTGKPIIGNRFNGDHDPAIQTAEITTVQNSVRSLSNITEVKVELKVSTVRVYAVVNSTLDKEAYAEIAESIYQEVLKTWPEGRYFSVINGTQKQYDLEIHVLNSLTDTDSADFKYYILTKNSYMEEPLGQLVSDPINPELAAELLDKSDPTSTEDEEGDEVEAPGGLNEDEDGTTNDGTGNGE